MRAAEANFSASMRISSSIRLSLTGGQEDWMTKTSASRTFSSTFTLMFSLENRVTFRRPSGMPMCVVMPRARSGWLLPEKTFISPNMDPPMVVLV